MNYAGLMFMGVFVSFSLTYCLRRYALHKSLMDIPNARSSHSVPTPRGGGVAIVISHLLAMVLMLWAGVLDTSMFMAMTGAGLLIAGIGFIDDHNHIAARWRLLGHFTAAAWGLFWIGGLAPLSLAGFTLEAGLVGSIIAAFYLVWMLNLYNFMDGIDGIASVQALCACGGAALLYAITGHTELMWMPLTLAAAVAGFLFWNFPPARIFMGDAGSGFLGVTLGLLSLQAAWTSSSLFYAWLILLGVFVVDATVTLIRRGVRGDKVHEAHRSHAYQFASRLYNSHLRVTAAVGAINLFWLMPIAFSVVVFGFNAIIGIFVAYAPLVFLALRFRAGELELK
ncbi:MraY family glycosyltransferase [Pseudomonas huanghezhanensis]|uniref:MraY family glycosyltransferase n=1 Tax=Pseudomonas huanghezhanensis TaxID=3002903 RepID=UPI0022856382|nr:glycosyltransferase family 4 protein [Pseudomonas sp. BSw22131]